jgi:small subunit ribosomal protein S17
MRTVTGTVTGNKMQKTIVVTVDSYKKHPKYQKQYRISKKFYAHDEDGKGVLGERVTIYETKPMSKLKRWSTKPPVTTK